MESIHWHGREACKAYRVIRRADRMLRKKRWFPELLRWTQSPWKYFSMKEDFLPLLESTIFSKEKFIDPFLLSVIRPRRKTPGSPSTEDGGHNNCGIPTFLTKHGDKPLQSHQDIRGGGTATDVAPPPQLEQNDVRVDPLYPLQVQVVHLSHSPTPHGVKMDVQTSTRHLSVVVFHPDPVP